MKIIHTADWHLGKSLKNVPLTDEQSYILNGDFMKIVDNVKPDAVIIAGDVYDRLTPPLTRLLPSLTKEKYRFFVLRATMTARHV